MAEWVPAVLAGLAVLLQLAALTVLVGFLSRRCSSPIVLLITGVLLAMAIRRALVCAASVGLGLPHGVSITHEAAGLAGSVLVLVTAMLIAGQHRATSFTQPAESTGVDTARDFTSALRQERELLCYELHDGLAPLVVSAQMQLETYKAVHRGDCERAEEELGLLDKRLREAVDEVHSLIGNLSLTISQDVPLSTTVRSHLAGLAEIHGWQYDLDDALGEQRFDPTVEAMVCRVVQEALNNAAEHAQTDRVHVSLRVEDGQLVGAVRDWGVGFDPERARWNPRRLGLRGMCNRARLIGGRCEIESSPGAGTRVAIRVPCAVAGGGSDG